jgi:hypothetical protein
MLKFILTFLVDKYNNLRRILRPLSSFALSHEKRVIIIGDLHV